MYKDNINNDYEYNTPLYLFNYLHKHFKFELDPCDDGTKWLGLPYYFTKEEDGLSKDWNNNSFVNPPYGAKNEFEWIKKCIIESNKNKTANFILLPSKTEAKWFSYAMLRASVIIFPQKRINFLKNGKYINGNTMGSVLFGFVMTRDREDKKTLREWDCINSFVHENIDLGIPCKGSEDSGFFFFPDRDLLKEKYS